MGSCQSTSAATATGPPPTDKLSPPSNDRRAPAAPAAAPSSTVPDAEKSVQPTHQAPPGMKLAPLEKPPRPTSTGTGAAGGASGYSSDTSEAKHSYASGGSTPDDRSEDSSNYSARFERKMSNPKMLTSSTSAIGLDEMIDDRRETGDLRQNVVHIEVPFGKPIEEVYDGVHSGPVLGSGISGLVRLVTHKATGLKYAVKVLDLGLVDTTEGLKRLREEIFIMCQLDHPNIVRLEEVYESHSEIYLVQELCLGGELFDRLDEQPDYHYTEAECARLVKQMLSAVRYLHSKGIIHRDLKLENFLFSSTAKDSELKMIDFGLSKHFRYGEVHHEAVGTPYTVAPEVIRGTYDERCDIWAIGVITFLLLSGDPPFGGCGGPEPLLTVRANILKGAFSFEPAYIWENVSSLARDFIREMLVIDPKRRPTARQAQKHKWLVEWASRSRKGKDNVLNPNVVKALVNFKEFSDMRKLLCEVLSFTLLPDQIKELRGEFEKMDTDGSGEISLSALKQVLMTNAGAGSLGALTEEEVEDIFNAMRVRKTETRIHWHEFIAAGLSQCQVDDRNLRLAFDRLDSDHKGYITLDDIMDLMGGDAIQSEDDMRKMWGDSIKAVKCQHARITYDDFLLLMKGQTKEAPSQDLERELQKKTLPSRGGLHVVPEAESSMEEGMSQAPKVNQIQLPSGDMVLLDGLIVEQESNTVPNESVLTPKRPVTPLAPSRSAPSTPADHRRILDVECIESPLSMDDDADITSSGPGIPGSAASLTPPTSPERGARDYVTPMSGRNRVTLEASNTEYLTIPALPGKTDSYVRRGRSRSVGDESPQGSEKKDLHVVADVVRDMLLPETDHTHIKKGFDDKTKSVIKVNRQLYRAHRQMRHAVLEASKRFEEQQAAHARELILAQREAEGKSDGLGMIQAGLVMRHGHAKQVSSEAIRKLLQENRIQQQALVEKANRRGGRGRRSRKKTISDMSGMLSTSMTQDEFGTISNQIGDSGQAPPLEESKTFGGTPNLTLSDSPAPVVPDLTAENGRMRGATVPGDFKKTTDPFSSRGLYGAAAEALKKP